MAEQAFIKIISIPEYQDNGLKGKIADYVDDMRSQYRYLPDEFLNDLLKNISGLFRCMREEWDCFLNPYLETPAGTPIYVLASQKEKEEKNGFFIRIETSRRLKEEDNDRKIDESRYV